MSPSKVAKIILAVVCAVPMAATAEQDPLRGHLEAGRYAAAEKAAAPLAKRGGHKGADARLLLGRVQLETGRYEEAARTARSARKARGTKAAAHLLEGEALLRVGKTAAALRALRAAVEAAGDSGDETEWRAKVFLARAYMREGNVLGARPIWDALADAFNEDRVAESDGAGLWAVASAVAALEYWQDANETYTSATKADRTRVETQTDWARLFLEKYDPGHAEECLRDALKANPHHAEAHALMAKVRMKQGFDFVRANEEIDAALATNPNLVEAYAFRATLHVRDRLWERAHEDLDRALAIDPADPYALSVRAAVYYVADDRRRYEQTVAKLRSRHRRFTGHYGVLTDLLEWEHRYEEIVELNREALGVDSGYWPAHAAIGLNLLRMGEDEEGVAALTESRRHDRFHVLAYNTVSLYEDVLGSEYSYSKRGPIRYRFHKNDQKVLERYLPKLLGRGYREMSKRYRIRPAKTTVEVFTTEDHFARRSVGLPRIGVQGICFGNVVVAAGPRAVPVNYGQVLWHELGHVFTIRLSKSRVPRWFTEGLAVLEESRGDPHWRREDDAAHYRWVKAGRMPGVASLNTAFSRARSPVEVGLAYYGSAKLSRFIEDRYGWPKVLQMLKLYGRGMRTPEVVHKALGVTPEQLDAQYREHVDKSLGRYGRDFEVDYAWYYDRRVVEGRAKASPGDAKALGLAAVSAMAHRDKRAAEGWARKALKVDSAQPHARHVLSDIAAATGNWAKATEHAKALISKGVDGYALRLNLAHAAQKRGDRAGAIRELHEASKIDPQRIEPFVRLAKIHLDDGRGDQALIYMQKAADLDQHDRGLYRDLVGRLAKQKRWDLVRRYGERSLWNDPFHTELHVNLVAAYAHGGDLRRAAFEHQSAVLTDPDHEADVHASVAEAYHRVGKRREAKAAARRALAADPGHAAAKQLLEGL